MTFLVRTSHNFYRTRFSVPFLWLVTLSQASLQRLGGGGERNRSRTKADDRYAKFLPTYDKRVIPEIIFIVETIVLLIKTFSRTVTSLVMKISAQTRITRATLVNFRQSSNLDLVLTKRFLSKANVLVFLYFSFSSKI